MEQTIVMLNVADLRPMENYRKAMDEKKMAELTESVKARGVIQPILCRPGKNVIGHEIVFGQRRWKAAQRAGLAVIPAMVRNIDDAEALELQIIENTQKEDPNPMEEGLGFKKLLELGKHTPETLAAKLDKSADYVLGRIKLTALPKDAQDKMLSGEIGIGHALQLTRLRNEGDIKKLAKKIIDDDMSVSDVRSWLREQSTEISKAVFDLAACDTCGHRSRAQVALFPEAKQDGDRCMDRSCFFTRTRDHYTAQADDLAKTWGVTIHYTRKSFDQALQKAGKTATEIATSKNDEYYGRPAPKLWKTQCQKCDKRAFGYWKEDNWQGSHILIKWACLDRKCLNKMNKVPAERAETGSAARPSNGPSGASTQRAIECRDRFLYREVPPRIAQSRTLQLRLAISHLLDHFDELYGENPDESLSPQKDRDTVFKKLTGKKYGWKDNYAAIAALPEQQLPQALLDIALAASAHTEPETLLLMTPEAGIDLSAAVVVDRPYLEGKTKTELDALVKAFGIKNIMEGAPADYPAEWSDLSSAQRADQILRQDLAGKLPKDIAERCELKTLAGMKTAKAPKATAKKKKGK